MWAFATTLLFVYLGLCAFFYFFQDFLFFRPERLPRYFKYKYPFPFDEVHFEMPDGGYVNGIHFKVPNSKGVVYYLKGNSRSVKGWGKFAKDFVSKGYDFFMIDYRGFGKSSGKRSEEILFSDAQYAYKWLNTQYDEANIVIYGRSLGSGIATRVASWNNPQMLILDSPYYSFRDQIGRHGFFLPLHWILRYQIRSDQFIKKVSAPIFYIHGTRDRLISSSCSERLMALNPTRAKLFPIEKGGHNNLPEYPEYHDVLYDILNEEAI
jgi:pimeloyl-ACP methyl ester carboxylesterase